MNKPFSTLRKKMSLSAQKAATAKTQRMLKDDEDTAMLVRLVKIRQNLWT
ncbi:MAG TPA: hypothetical protein VLH77_01990 [Gammaproteobacteria bacterium]|nr:hypothetical protein [Gammaproteobacteria bacterium]